MGSHTRPWGRILGHQSGGRLVPLRHLLSPAVLAGQELRTRNRRAREVLLLQCWVVWRSHYSSHWAGGGQAQEDGNPSPGVRVPHEGHACFYTHMCRLRHAHTRSSNKCSQTCSHIGTCSDTVLTHAHTCVYMFRTHCHRLTQSCMIMQNHASYALTHLHIDSSMLTPIHVCSRLQVEHTHTR